MNQEITAFGGGVLRCPPAPDCRTRLTPRPIRNALIALGVLAVTGCANMKSHDAVATNVQAQVQTGTVASAIDELDKSASSDSERAGLLYNLERGELLRLNKQYPESTQAFLKADALVNEWEQTAKTDPSKLLGKLGAALISERLSDYEGQDYEKVWLTTRLALNHLAQGETDNARADIKRTHEREAVIAEFRAKSVAAAEADAKAKGVASTGKELNGYPVETINDPAVLKLKNSYSNALSHYLAGFLYEVLNEPGLAAPGYRKAIELKPDTPLLDEGLRGLDTRTSFTHKKHKKMTDVLFVVEAGNAPARKPQAFTIPVPIDGMQTLSISYPVIAPSTDAPLSLLAANGQKLKLENVVDVNVMARRALKDDMPGMVVRGITRAIAKSVLQHQLSDHGGMFGQIVGMAASVYTEQADDRMWRMLPGRVYVARGYLPPGTYQLQIDGRDLGESVTVGGQYALIPIRLYESKAIEGNVIAFGELAPPAPPPSKKSVKRKKATT